MTGHVYWIFQLEIKPGEYENFEKLMTEMVDATKADEPDALNYEWSVSEDKKTCHILERFKDSDAALIHMGNFGSKFAGRFMEVLTPKLMTVYGDPSDNVLKGLSRLGAVHMPAVGGFSR
ncbi:antibiotic biosynthesis monooxygenase [uncultured Sneathiella sp.]|jgi:quinol monooxygenase YgiN|uniref:putative quinol monooxygenase n=1 Tax=uncultured Sneathiella sp. TaxID=879315 RepID=UPI0030D75BFF|tara:strand:+ start:749 stop:1108 length:360 start_codon:yes stop_codon:yes gene_type:complete